MAVRIYGLAKELKLDSKELVDICTRAGVLGKGSALASLTDEEAEKVKAFIASGQQRPAARPATPTGRPAMVPPPQRPAAAPPAVLRREDYVPASGTTGAKPPLLPPVSDKPAGEPKRKSGVTPEGGRPPLRVSPALKLAPLPPSQQPPPTAADNEPAPQKPDIKLPVDAIRAASKAGSKPLQEHLRKHEARRKAELDQQPPSRGGGRETAARGPAGPGALPSTTDRDRLRRGAKPMGAPASPGGTDEREMGGAAGREQRQLKRKRTVVARTGEGDEETQTTSLPRRGPLRLKRTGTNTAAPRKSEAVLELPCTVRSFSEAIGLPAQRVLGKLLTMGMPTNINADLNRETAELLAVELGVELRFKEQVDAEEQLLTEIDQLVDAPENLVPRAPVITFLGHVDHGKTSLLDRIIGINVVSGESGGITQHIRAYRIMKGDKPIAFVDTPGHEAFTQMRARGANVTDLAVLVVAADDGIMPQTEEAISHAKAAGVPIVVALNKMDLPGVNVDRIFQQLSTSGLQPTEWGGDTEVVRCSALTGKGMDELLDTLLTIAELHDYRANPGREATGTCLEAELHEGRGVIAKFLVQKGTLHVGDVVVCGSGYGRIKAMYDTLDRNKTYDEVGPSTPVNVTGLDMAPGAGEHFYVLDDIALAREIAEKRAFKERHKSLAGAAKPHVTLENLFERLGHEDDVQTLNLILRADVRGSIEAILKELTKLEHPEVQIKILQATVGGISEADVHLADASDAIIVGFNVVPDEKARVLAEQTGVQIRRYDIIYQVTGDVKLALEGMLKPEQREKELGRALVLRVFQISRLGSIAGCRVMAGIIERNARMRVIRDNRVIGDYPLDSLRREKDDAREVREGFECGIKLSGFNDVKEGDIFEAYKVEEIARTI